jgi:N-acetylglutamate synthase-like GNAT family acetyltransferase
VEVIHANEKSQPLIESFFKKLPLLEDISEELLVNTVILSENDIIKGLVSYECFDKIALIRFFIFQKELPENWLKTLMEEVLQKMKANRIKKVLSFVTQPKMVPIFSSFGFSEVDKKNLYLDETPLAKTDFNLNQVMVYSLG